MGDAYVKSGSGVTQFAQSTAYGVGDRVVVNRSDTGLQYLYARCFVWECTTAGTTAGAWPTWSASNTPDSTTITSGGAVFTCRKPGFSSGSNVNWSFASPFLDYLWGLGQLDGAIRIFVSNNHNQTLSAAVTLDVPTGGQNNFCQILCVDDSAGPPTALATGAIFRANSIIFDHWFYTYGIRYECATGAIGSVTGSRFRFVNCQLVLDHANSGSAINLIGSDYVEAELINVDVRFGHAAQGLICNSAQAFLRWIGGSLLSGGTSPTNLFTYLAGYGGGQGGRILLDGLDLTNANAAINIIGGSSAYLGSNTYVSLKNFKLPAGWSGSFAADPYYATRVFVHRCAIGADRAQLFHKAHHGTVQNEATYVRTGGASDDGSTLKSWKMVTHASNTTQFPRSWLESPEIAVWNAQAGVSKTINLEILHDSANNLKNNEIWCEVLYPKNSGDNLVGIASCRLSNLLGTAADHATSSETWYTTGMSAPKKQVMSVTFTPQQIGELRLCVKMAIPNKTVYVDPKPS